MPRRLLAYALVAAAVLLIALIPVLRRTGPASSRYADLAQMPELDTLRCRTMRCHTLGCLGLLHYAHLRRVACPTTVLCRAVRSHLGFA